MLHCGNTSQNDAFSLHFGRTWQLFTRLDYVTLPRLGMGHALAKVARI